MINETLAYVIREVEKDSERDFWFSDVTLNELFRGGKVQQKEGKLVIEIDNAEIILTTELGRLMGKNYEVESIFCIEKIEKLYTRKGGNKYCKVL